MRVRGFVRVGPGEYLVGAGLVGGSRRCRCGYCGMGFDDVVSLNAHVFEHEKRGK